MPTNFVPPSKIINAQLQVVEQFFDVYDTNKKLYKHWLTQNTLDNLQFVYVIHKTNSKQYKIGLCEARKGGTQTVEKRIATQTKDVKAKLLALIFATPAGHQKKDFRQQSLDNALFANMEGGLIDLQHDIKPIFDITTSSNTSMSTWFTTEASTEKILTNLQQQCSIKYTDFTIFVEFSRAGLKKALKQLPKCLNFEVDGNNLHYTFKRSKVHDSKVSEFPTFARIKAQNAFDFAQIEAQKALNTYRNALIYKATSGREYTYYVFDAYTDNSTIYLQTRLLNDKLEHTPAQLQRVKKYKLNEAKRIMWVELPQEEETLSWTEIREKYFNNVNYSEYFNMLKDVLGTTSNGTTIPHSDIDSVRVPVPWGRKGNNYDFSKVQPLKKFSFKLDGAAIWKKLSKAARVQKVAKAMPVVKPSKTFDVQVTMPSWWCVWQKAEQFESIFVRQRFRQHAYAGSSKAQ